MSAGGLTKQKEPNMTDSTPTARIITLTPAIASGLLDKNPRNRTIGAKNYAIVLRAIQRGEWKLNGEAIMVARDGTLLDGQHRCLAVVESGIAIETFIVENLDAVVQDTMNTGKSRSLGDILHIRGYVNSTALASIVRRIYVYETHGLKASTAGSYPTTNHEVLAFFERNLWIEQIVPDSKRIAAASKLPGSVVGLLTHVFQTIDRDDAAFFLQRLETGENLQLSSPIYVLRRALTILSESKGAMNQSYLVAIAVKAWNKYRDGEPIAMLKFLPGGANPESFPVPR